MQLPDLDWWAEPHRYTSAKSITRTGNAKFNDGDDDGAKKNNRASKRKQESHILREK